jgi:hypothetical protein
LEALEALEADSGSAVYGGDVIRWMKEPRQTVLLRRFAKRKGSGATIS